MANAKNTPSIETCRQWAAFIARRTGGEVSGTSVVYNHKTVRVRPEGITIISGIRDGAGYDSEFEYTFPRGTPWGEIIRKCKI
jgi:hypothetical protein